MTEQHITSAEEFERGYAERAGWTVEELRAVGRIVAPCVCDYEECTGWQSISRASWDGDPWYRVRHGGDGWRWPVPR